MQVKIDVKLMHTNFGGCGLSGFGDTATLKNGQISLSTHYSPWSSNNLIDRNRLKKIMQVKIDVKFMHTNFGGCVLSGFRDTATLKDGQISPSTHFAPFLFPFKTVKISFRSMVYSSCGSKIGISSKYSCK